MKLTIFLLVASAALAQQNVSPNGSLGPADNHAATKTLPHRSGTGSPNARDNCATVGESYFQTDAAAGSNIFGCTATGTPGTWTVQGGSAATYFSPGVNTAVIVATAPTANHTYCSAIPIPAGGLSVGHMVVDITTADGGSGAVNDFGWYNAAGTLIADWSPTSLSTGGQRAIAFTQGTVTIPAGINYVCLTSSVSVLKFLVGNIGTPYVYTDIGVTTSGGQLASSITPPAATYNSNGLVLLFFVYP